MGIFQQFPYTNFHEMNLDEIIRIVLEMQAEWEETKAEWASYKDFIDNYFDTLDLTEEVYTVILRMIDSGELNEVIDPTIISATEEWLAENITEPVGVVIDSSLTVRGACADAKATGVAIRANTRSIEDVADAIVTEREGRVEADDRLDRKKVNMPLNNNGQPINGVNGQCLRTKGNGATEWASIGQPTDAQAQQAINTWLNNHPEATTTVQDGAVTFPKLSTELQEIVNNTAELNVILSEQPGATYNDKLTTALASITESCRIFLPAGVIELGEIDLPTTYRVAFIGMGMGTNGDVGTKIKPISGTTTYIFGANSTGCDFHSFENINFDGDNTCDYGIKGDYATGFIIKRCSFYNFTDTACFLGLGLNYISDSYFNADNSASCLRIHSDSHVRDSEFSGGTPVVTIEASGNRFVGNLINNGTKGVFLNPALSIVDDPLLTPIANNNTITDTYFGHVAGYDIYIGGTSGNATGNIITNNYHEMTYNNDEGAIYAENCKTVQISNIILRGTASTSMLPAIVLIDCENSIISNIMAYNVWNDIITLVRVADSIVNSVVSRNGDGTVISLDTAYRNLITDVMVLNDGAGTVAFATDTGGANNFFKDCVRNGTSYSLAASDLLFDADFENQIQTTLTPAVTTSTIRLNRIVRSETRYVEIDIDMDVSQDITNGNKILDIPSAYRSNAHYSTPLFVGMWDCTANAYIRGYIQNGGLYAAASVATGHRLAIHVDYTR